MRRFGTLLLAAISVVSLGACTMSLSDQDRALLTSASQNARQAKDLAQQALAAAQAAQASANNAAQTASQATNDAQAGSEKADIVARQSQGKRSQ